MSMHLTYETFHTCADDASCEHASNAEFLHTAVTLHALNPGLGSLGSFVKKLLDFKKKITPKPLRKLVDLEGKVLNVIGKNAKFIAPIVSFIPVVGWIVGAAVTVVGADYARAKQKADQLAANTAAGADLVNQYQAMAGTVPGRLITDKTLRDVIIAWAGNGLMGHPHPPSLYPGIADAIMRVTAEAVRRGIARGAVSLKDIYDVDFPAVLSESPPNGQPGSDQWMVPQSPTEAQLIIDAMDIALARQAPNSAITYGVMTEPVTTPAPVPAPVSTSAPASTPVPVPAPTSTPAPVPALSADINADMLAAIKMMITQGQSAQAATNNVLAALASKNVTATAEQTAAIKTAAEQTATGQPVTAGQSIGNMALWGLGAVALIFSLARPEKRKQ